MLSLRCLVLIYEWTYIEFDHRVSKRVDGYDNDDSEFMFTYKSSRTKILHWIKSSNVTNNNSVDAALI